MANASKASISELRKTDSNKMNEEQYSKFTGELVDKAIQSSKNHFPILQMAGIHAVLMAAEHGRFEHMNRLYSETVASDGASFGYFVGRLNRTYGGTDNQGRNIPIFSFNKDGKDGNYFGFNKSQEVPIKNSVKANRKKLVNAGEEKLRKVEWLTPEARDSTTEALTEGALDTRIAKAVIQGLNKGVYSPAKANELKRILSAANQDSLTKIESTIQAIKQAERDGKAEESKESAAA